MSRRRKLVSLSQVIAESVENGFLGLAREMVRVFEVWDEAVGPYNASKARPESIMSGRLTVLVESPAWIDHFSYLKKEFKDKINQALGAPLVTEITFKVGALDRPLPKSESQTMPMDKKAAVIEEDPMTLIDSPTLRASLASVGDPELRDRLARLMVRQRGARKELS